MSTQYPILNDREWMVEQYETKERTMGDIADEVGCCTITVRNSILRHGIETRGASPRDGPIERTLVVNMYESGAKIEEITEEANCVLSTMYEILDENDVERREQKYDELQDAEWLEEALEEKSQVEISDMLGCSEAAVSVAVKRHKLRA